MAKRSWADTSRLHDHRHTDYDEAKAQIHKAIGEIEEVELFGRQVLVAIYMRPSRTLKGFYQTAKFQEEDIYQGQIVLVLGCGPDAFKGDDGYLAATFGQCDMPRPVAPAEPVMAQPPIPPFMTLPPTKLEIGESVQSMEIRLADERWQINEYAEAIRQARIDHDAEMADYRVERAAYHQAAAAYTAALDALAPKPGDWLILRPNAGELISLRGDRAEQPMGEDNFGKPIPLYEFTGWPCKIVADEMFLGRIKQPHVLV